MHCASARFAIRSVSGHSSAVAETAAMITGGTGHPSPKDSLKTLSTDRSKSRGNNNHEPPKEEAPPKNQINPHPKLTQ
jgi:hypothetical protein